MDADRQGRERVISQRYQQRRRSGKAGWTDDDLYQRKHDRLTAFLARHPPPPHGRFLELGCGAGNLTVGAARLGLEAHGIDLSGEAIAWARENAERAGVSATFHQGSVVDLASHADGSFDIVFDGDCLWMVVGADRPVCFANVWRVLRPGGWLHAQAHLVDEAFQERYPLGENAWYDPQQRFSTVDGIPLYQYCTAAGFLGELRSAGFEIGNTQPEPVVGSSASLPFLAGDLFADACKPG